MPTVDAAQNALLCELVQAAGDRSARCAQQVGERRATGQLDHGVALFLAQQQQGDCSYMHPQIAG